VTRWLILLLVPVAALALGAALVPSGLEQAFMFMHDREYTKAAESFQAKWEKGNRTREVANALAELHVREGNPTRAADILVEFISANPADTQALARLAEIFRDDQQRNRYIATLERLYELKKDTGILHALQKLYELAGREDDQIRTLETIVRAGAAELPDMVTLADLLSARNPKRSIEVLYNAFRRWPKDITVDTAQTMTALATGEDRPDLVRTVIMPWLATRKSFRDVEPIAVSLTAERLDSLALEAVKASGAFAAADPQSVVLAARLESRAGQQVPAYTRLKALLDRQKLPPKGDDVFIETALLSGKPDEAVAHVLKRGPANLPFWLQSWFVAKLKDAGNTDALRAVATKYEADTSPAALFLRAHVALASGQKAEAKTLAQRAATSINDVPAAIAMAGLMAELGDTTAARKLMHDYAPGPDHVTLDDLAPATAIALTLRERSIAMPMAEKLREQRPGTVSDILYARALGLSGKAEEALAILDDLDAWSEARETATFEVLKGAGRNTELQTRLLERLDSGDTTLQQRTAYVFELNGFKSLSVKVPDDVAGILEDDLEADKALASPRLARIELLGKFNGEMALPYALDAAEQDPAAATYIYLQLLKRLNRPREAAPYIESVLPDISDERLRQSLLQEWITVGVTRPALHYLKELADSGDRQWFYACDEALRKLGPVSERVAFLTAYARRTDLDPEFRGQLASQILDVGGKQVALELFKQDAEDAPPRSKAVEQVLFLWGPRPPREGIDWLLQRARKGAPQDRAAWLTRLVDANAASEALPLAAEWYQSGDDSVTEVLATCLEQLRRKGELQSLLRQEASRNLDARRAARLATAGESLGLLDEALVLYERAAANEPVWFKAAGRAALYAGKPARAVSLLRKVDASRSRDADFACIFAEAHYQSRQKSEALRLYEDCLGLSRKMTADRSKSVRYQMMALARLQRDDEAEALLSKSGDSDLKADYAAILLDRGDTGRAALFMAKDNPR
jgi:tetratricopeptide (TPR) repeat protein